GACTSGSTAHPRGATRPAPGGAATTSTTRAERRRGRRAVSWRRSAALRCQRGGDDRLVRVHVGDGRDADARRLSPCLLPGGTRARPYAAGRRRHGLATRFSCRTPPP